MKKFFSVILVLVFITGFSISTLLYTTTNTLLNPVTYIKALQENDIYNQIPEIAIKLLKQDPKMAQTLSQLPPTVEERLPQIFRAVFPPEWIKEQAESFINQIASWANGETSELSLRLDFREGKRAAGSEGLKAFNEFFKSLPTCTARDLQAFGQGGVECLPAGISADMILRAVGGETGIQKLLSSFPDTFDVTDLIAKQPNAAEIQEQLAYVPQAVSILKILVIVCYVFTAFLLVLLLLINRKPKSSLLKWVGFALLAAGLIPVLLFYSIPAGLEVGTVNLMPQGVSPEMLTMLSPVVKQIFSLIFTPGLWVSGGAAMVGLVFLVLGIVSKTGTE